MYELRLQGGKVVRWPGDSGPDAAERYVDAHRDAVVIAWREDQSPQIRAGAPLGA